MMEDKKHKEHVDGLKSIRDILGQINSTIGFLCIVMLGTCMAIDGSQASPALTDYQYCMEECEHNRQVCGAFNTIEECDECKFGCERFNGLCTTTTIMPLNDNGMRNFTVDK